MNAAFNARIDLMELLLDRSADVDAQKPADGCTALLCAIQGVHLRASSRIDSVDRLTGHAADAQPQDDKLRSGDLRPIRMLLEAHVDPDQLSAKSMGGSYCVTPLLFAAQLGSVAVARLLLDAKAHPECHDARVPNPLVVACVNRNAELARLLLQRGAQAETPDLGATALTISCEQGEQCAEIIEMLLEHKASPDRADACGNTPLMWACEANSLVVASMLLNAGACPRRVNASGDAALNIALKHAESTDRSGAGHSFSTPLVQLLTKHTAMTAPPLLQRRVVLRGLSSRPELNGRRGTAISFDAKTGRYGVQLDGGTPRERVALRPATLRPVSEEEEEERVRLHAEPTLHNSRPTKLEAATGVVAAGAEAAETASAAVEAAAKAAKAARLARSADATLAAAAADANAALAEALPPSFDDDLPLPVACGGGGGGGVASVGGVAGVAGGTGGAEPPATTVRSPVRQTLAKASQARRQDKLPEDMLPRPLSSANSTFPSASAYTSASAPASASPLLSLSASPFTPAPASPSCHPRPPSGRMDAAAARAVAGADHAAIAEAIVALDVTLPSSITVTKLKETAPMLEVLERQGAEHKLPAGAVNVAQRVSAWIERANTIVIEQQQQLLSHSIEARRAAVHCLTQGCYLMQDMLEALASTVLSTVQSEERMLLESQRADAEEKAAREAEAHVVTALQQAASQGQARQEAERQLARMVEQVAEERDKGFALEDATGEANEAVGALQRSLEQARSSHQAELGRLRQRHESELASVRAELDGQMQRTAAGAAAAMQEAEKIARSTQAAHADEVKRLRKAVQISRGEAATASQATAKALEKGAKAVQAAKAAEARLAQAMSVELPRQVAEVQQSSDARVRKAEQQLRRAEMARREMQEKLAEVEERSASANDLIQELRSQLLHEAAARRAAEEASSARRLALNEAESARHADAQCARARAEAAEGARRAAEERVLAAESAAEELRARLGKISQKAAARGVEADAQQQLAAARERCGVEVAQRKQAEQALKAAEHGRKAAEAEAKAAKAKLGALQRKVEEEEGLRIKSEEVCAELRREQLKQRQKNGLLMHGWTPGVMESESTPERSSRRSSLNPRKLSLYENRKV